MENGNVDDKDVNEEIQVENGDKDILVNYEVKPKSLEPKAEMSELQLNRSQEKVPHICEMRGDKFRAKTFFEDHQKNSV